jgi:hypothetical protein
MNRTIQNLQNAYALRFLAAAIAVAAAAGAAHLLWLGRTGEYMLPAIVILIAGCAWGWHALIDLWGRRKHLRQLLDRLGNDQVHGGARLATEIEADDAARGAAGRSPLHDQKFSYGETNNA